ncbi:virulence factor [Parapusillimonas sp. JC17]|uniref:virulence factor n=1 Tax=Parapusillimonas sp. JC17 TaxID=3445768 RepID=UPI003FA14223
MKRILLAGAAMLAMLTSGAAMARGGVDVNISIGVPGVIYTQPDYYYPPVRYVERPRVVVVPERIYQPVPVYRSDRYYRKDFRGPKHYHKHHKGHHKHHHRHGR